MRGALRDAPWVAKGIGIIPAYAGSTDRLIAFGQMAGDHPRVCGEHVARNFARWLTSGSSPRMRGALDKANFIADRTGIIPAYAGSTQGAAP